jgi:long-chain acyl-CoA synthetase
MTIANGSLEHHAQASPDRVALIEADRTITFRDWNLAADRVANALAARGLAAGDIAVVRTQLRIEWAIVAAALAKLGCSLLALNWRLTPSEVRYVLDHSGARAVICDDLDPGPLVTAIADLSIKLVVSLDAGAPGTTSFAELLQGAATPRFSRSDPPLIIYTSGTTGQPKGVVMGNLSPHYTPAQAAEYFQDVRQSRRWSSEPAVVLITMPVHHASGPAQVWGAMRKGRTVVLLRRFTAEDALRLIERHKVTDWAAVPTMLKRISELPAEVLVRYQVHTIRQLSVGAAPVSYELKDWALAYFGEDCLTEGYGSTETGMVTRLLPDMQRKKPGSSGLAYKHVGVSVRAPDGTPLPAGQAGEIWVRTPMTLRGYLHGGELDPESLDRDGYFRIGDIGYLDDDGYLYLTDRANDLIISGGVNIYPAEIERVLGQHPAVSEVAVIGIPDDAFGEQVMAFVMPKPGAELTAAELQQLAAQQLASYKRPRTIELVDELPRNAMGKVLKRELREPYWRDRERKI